MERQASSSVVSRRPLRVPAILLLMALFIPLARAQNEPKLIQPLKTNAVRIEARGPRRFAHADSAASSGSRPDTVMPLRPPTMVRDRDREKRHRSSVAARRSRRWPNCWRTPSRRRSGRPPRSRHKVLMEDGCDRQLRPKRLRYGSVVQGRDGDWYATLGPGTAVTQNRSFSSRNAGTELAPRGPLVADSASSAC
jgi:hypothetical protein